jgi:hypothetical protein
MSRIAARWSMLAVIAMLMLVAMAAGSAAAGTQARAPLSGVVPHAGAGAHALRPEAGAGAADDVFLQESPCSPPSCWVMRTNTTYAIYWTPTGAPQSVQPGYENAIDQYLSDVAAASASQTNVYSVATQYYDATGFISDQSTFGGSDIDTDPFPANGCNDGVDSVCLTDQQLQAEIQKVVTAKAWTDGPDSLFFILTPDGVGSCFDALGTQCTTNFYCAYHSGFVGTDGQPILYANEPYDASIDGCRSGPSPNGDDADATLNTMSHEQNEAITDPWGNAWLNSGGDEIADICAWNFGTPLGTASNGQPYNQLINGHPYALQQDYSNDGSVCRQSYVGLPANTALPALSGVAVEKQPVSASQGAWTQVPTAYAYQWLRCTATGTACAAISGATSATYVPVVTDSGQTLEVRVSATNARGTTEAASEPSAAVVGVPAGLKAPHISGRARIGRQLSAGRGLWSGPPQTYRFQWLRCNSRGGSCVSIRRATHTKYRLTKHDGRHRLRVRVTAVNAAGSKTATSRATARVAAAKR